eukprot:42567_1
MHTTERGEILLPSMFSTCRLTKFTQTFDGTRTNSQDSGERLTSLHFRFTKTAPQSIERRSRKEKTRHQPPDVIGSVIRVPIDGKTAAVMSERISCARMTQSFGAESCGICARTDKHSVLFSTRRWHCLTKSALSSETVSVAAYRIRSESARMARTSDSKLAMS